MKTAWNLQPGMPSSHGGGGGNNGVIPSCMVATDGYCSNHNTCIGNCGPPFLVCASIDQIVPEFYNPGGCLFSFVSKRMPRGIYLAPKNQFR